MLIENQQQFKLSGKQVRAALTCRALWGRAWPVGWGGQTRGGGGKSGHGVWARLGWAPTTTTKKQRHVHDSVRLSPTHTNKSKLSDSTCIYMTHRLSTKSLLRTSTLRQRKGRAPQPSITLSCQAGGGSASGGSQVVGGQPERGSSGGEGGSSTTTTTRT